jgi:hypothetical protein
MRSNSRKAARTMKQINLFAEETQLERLSKLGDSLERLKIIDFESFRPILNVICRSIFIFSSLNHKI